MNARFLFNSLLLTATVLIAAGCATGPSPSADAQPEPNLPRTFLSGANVEQAKGLAMGTAVSKGWKIVESSDDRLLFRRPLNPAASGSAPGASTPTRVEVQTDFFQRQGGVDVALRAWAITNDGKKGEQKQDYTERYRDDLMQSLTSLRSAWERSRGRVATSVPPLPTSSVAAQGEEPGVGPDATTGTQVSDTTGDTGPGEGVRTAWAEGSSSPAPPAVEPEAPGSAPPTVPIESRQVETTPAGPTPSPISTGAIAGPTARPSSDPASNMMVLNEPASTGMWAYYAEHYAKTHGCSLGGQGARLVEKRPGFEVHRVHCEGQQDYLVKCNAGVCQGVQ